MRRWLLKADQVGVDALSMEEAPMPEPGPGEVRIRVHATSLNYRDQLVLTDLANWRRPGVALVPVADGAGQIDALGNGVEGWQVGDRVVELYHRGWRDGPPPLELTHGPGAGNEQGMLAEYVVFPASRIARAPAGLDWAEAATLPCAGLTAWNAVFGGKPVGAGSRVLVLGSGGVSLFALLLARAAGAEVYATSSSDEKLARMKALGASETINYRDVPDWGDTLFKRFGGVDKVVDPVGELNRAMAAIRPGGEVAVMGLMSSDGPLNPMLYMARTLTIRGTAVGSAASYEQLRAFVEQHGLRPPIARRFAFEDARAAYEAQAAGAFGKIVIEAPR